MTISQELLLREDVFRLVCVGVKRSTLRKGRRDIKTGPLAFKMTENPKIQMVVNVTKVTYLSLAEITENEATKEGYTSLSELRDVLYQIYGEIDDTELFTCVEFEPCLESLTKAM